MLKWFHLFYYFLLVYNCDDVEKMNHKSGEDDVDLLVNMVKFLLLFD